MTAMRLNRVLQKAHQPQKWLCGINQVSSHFNNDIVRGVHTGGTRIGEESAGPVVQLVSFKM